MTSKSIDSFKRSLRFLGAGSSTLSKIYQSEYEPAVIARGKGCRIWDLDGREYIDFRNGLGPVTLGYSFREINNAIIQQLKKGIVFGHPHRLEAEAAEKLISVIPCAEKVRFLKTGGEAVAACIKIARAYTGRDDIIHCGYNGWLNVLSKGEGFRVNINRDAALKGIPVDIAKHHLSLPWADCAKWKEAIEQRHKQIAAVVIACDYAEFYQAKEFLPFLRELTAQYGILIIMDEIVMGFRIALGGAHDFFNIKPDLAVFAKGLANGMPVSVYCGRAELIDLSGEIGISSTYGGETLSLAALIKVIACYQKYNVIARLKESGEYIWNKVNSLFQIKKIPAEMKGHPACKALTFAEKDAGKKFMKNCFRQGVSLYHVAYVNYSHAKKDLDEAYCRIEKAVQNI
ncbi:MAG: hypothetical protein A2096_17680 [Spirochaetes bacterium GWF1_41_5]|nr:MAG: hypothetical protein A2096_17680 [Spirochaetes bacterium GWF1_41_5]